MPSATVAVLDKAIQSQTLVLEFLVEMRAWTIKQEMPPPKPGSCRSQVAESLAKKRQTTDDLLKAIRHSRGAVLKALNDLGAKKNANGEWRLK